MITKTSVRFDNETTARLLQLAKWLGLSQSNVLRLAIKEMHRRQQRKDRGHDSN